jgi:hypothetical protein
VTSTACDAASVGAGAAAGALGSDAAPVPTDAAPVPTDAVTAAPTALGAAADGGVVRPTLECSDAAVESELQTITDTHHSGGIIAGTEPERHQEARALVRARDCVCACAWLRGGIPHGRPTYVIDASALSSQFHSPHSDDSRDRDCCCVCFGAAADDALAAPLPLGLHRTKQPAS